MFYLIRTPVTRGLIRWSYFGNFVFLECASYCTQYYTQSAGIKRLVMLTLKQAWHLVLGTTLHAEFWISATVCFWTTQFHCSWFSSVHFNNQVTMLCVWISMSELYSLFFQCMEIGDMVASERYKLYEVTIYCWLNCMLFFAVIVGLQSKWAW